MRMATTARMATTESVKNTEDFAEDSISGRWSAKVALLGLLGS